ncbi:MAG: DUF2255 family protein [Candidatus Limnocylindria bacterium]
MTFDSATLARLRDVREVEIETTSPAGATHRAIIWVVADQHDAFVRSWRGRRGRWYRELRDHPEGALLIGDDRIPVRAVAATEPAVIELVSYLLEAKYGRTSRASTQSMLLPETLPTTMRLQPA